MGDKSFPRREYSVLAPVSRSYPEPKGKFPRVTHPSATRVTLRRGALVRLACVKPAASVRSEPGSNSQVERIPYTSKRLVCRISALRGKPRREAMRHPGLRVHRCSLNAPPPTLLFPIHNDKEPGPEGPLSPHPPKRGPDKKRRQTCRQTSEAFPTAREPPYKVPPRFCQTRKPAPYLPSKQGTTQGLNIPYPGDGNKE